MYFKDLDINSKKYFFELKEDFSGAFVFLSFESQFLATQLVEISNSVGINVVICVCPTIIYPDKIKTIGFEVIPIDIEKILNFSPNNFISELDFLNLYYKKESKFGCAIVDESFYLENRLDIRLKNLKFKSKEIYLSKLDNSNKELIPTLYTNQGKLNSLNIFLVFKNVEFIANDTSIKSLKLLLGNTFNTVENQSICYNTLEFY